MRLCKVCNTSKHLDEFYNNFKSRDPDKKQSRCKACSKINGKKWSAENLDKRRGYDRAREGSPERKLSYKKKRLKRLDYYLEYFRNYHKENRDSILENKKEYNMRNKITQRDKILKKKYGISLEEYKDACIATNNQCQICKVECKLNVDHCHSTGNVRGLLCGNCNIGIGNMQDSVDILIKAIEYLRGELNNPLLGKRGQAS